MTPDDVVVISLAGVASALFVLSTSYYAARRWLSVRVKKCPQSTNEAPEGLRFPQVFL
tara:strand:+ start:586 stop:759 length:174 start_codon:yes stop_codon:yes gene_type:complete